MNKAGDLIDINLGAETVERAINRERNAFDVATENRTYEEWITRLKPCDTDSSGEYNAVFIFSFLDPTWNVHQLCQKSQRKQGSWSNNLVVHTKSIKCWKQI